MPSVQYYAAASLDGYIARLNGDIDWLLSFGAEAGLDDGPMSDGSYDEFYDAIGALVMGSATYEWITQHAAAWPYDRPTWVFTSRELAQPTGGRVQFVEGDAATVCDAARKAAGQRNVWMLGGGNLASQWASQGLIDEVILTVVPVFLGEGLPFFAEAVQGELRHVSTKTHGNGMVELRFSMPGSH